MNDLAGSVLNQRYHLDSLLEEELLGLVYRGTDLSTKHPVNVKVLHAHLLNNDEKRARFEREAKVMSKLNHPATIRLLDSGVSGAFCYMVLEHAEGTPLRTVLKSGPLAPTTVAHIAHQVAAGIQGAHAQGITHRGLQPQNILLLDRSDSPSIKIRDFGQAKVEELDDGGDQHLTQAGARLGNAAYMAPEYIERDSIGPRSDLYALGCVMYEMLSGRPPFQGRAVDVLAMHIQEPVDRLPDEVPEWLRHLVYDLLRKEPSERPDASQAAETIANGLGRAQSGGLSVSKLLIPTTMLFFIAGLVATVGMLIFAGAMVYYNVDPLTPTAEPLVPEPHDGPTPNAQASPADEPSKQESAPTPAKADDGVLLPTDNGEAALSRPPTAPDRGQLGVLQVTSDKRALVFVDGKPMGYTPIHIELPLGSHKVSAALPNIPTSKQTKTAPIERGETTTLQFGF